MSRSGRSTTKVVRPDELDEVTAASTAREVKGAAPAAIPAPTDPGGSAPPKYPPREMDPAIPTQGAPETRPEYGPGGPPPAIAPTEEES